MSSILDADKNNHKTNTKHFSQFRKAVLRFVGLFGLKEWAVTFCHNDLNGALANCSHHTQARSVCFNFGRDWRYDCPDKEMIEQVAFHEVCELLTSEYRDIINADISNEQKHQWAERVDHALIRRLENVVLPRL